MAACFGLSTAVNAQNMEKASDKGKAKKEMKKDWTPEQRAEKGAQWAEKSLGLNADQKAKWQAAALTRIKANEPLREQLKTAKTDQAERQKIREQIKSNNQAFESNISGFLTAEQKAKWDDIKKKKMDAHKMKKGKGPDKDDAEMKDIDQD